jgi:predicted rRNA methylase YqxC with S4 and FtsJ domains
MNPPTGFVLPLLERHVKPICGCDYSKFQLHYQFNLKKEGVKNIKEYE